MRIFVTGATGYIGLAVAEALAVAGHEVHGMVRSPAKAGELSRREIIPVLCSLGDRDILSKELKGCEAVVHCAADYSNDFLASDRSAVEDLVRIARETALPRHFIYTSGVWVYGNTGSTAVTEAAIPNPPEYLKPRLATERYILQQNSGPLRTIVIRPGCVYGGAGGLTARWFGTAEATGAAEIIGEGSNRWTMVHIRDLADLYVRAVESPYGGEIFNATDRSRFTVRECAEAASRAVGADGSISHRSAAEATREMGPFVAGLLLDQHVDSSRAVRLLGWQPRHGGFADGAHRYYQSWNQLR